MSPVLFILPFNVLLSSPPLFCVNRNKLKRSFLLTLATIDRAVETEPFHHVQFLFCHLNYYAKLKCVLLCVRVCVESIYL